MSLVRTSHILREGKGPLLESLVQFIRSSISDYDVVKDTLDILLVAYLIYQILKWTKGTRAMSVLKGLGVILILSQLTSFLRLNAITWVPQIT